MNWQILIAEIFFNKVGFVTIFDVVSSFYAGINTDTSVQTGRQLFCGWVIRPRPVADHTNTCTMVIISQNDKWCPVDATLKSYASIVENLLFHLHHYSDVIMGGMASQITGISIVYSTVYSGTVQRKYQSSVSLAFVRGIHRRPVNSPHKGPVTQKMFPFDDVIMWLILKRPYNHHAVGHSHRLHQHFRDIVREGTYAVKNS